MALSFAIARLLPDGQPDRASSSSLELVYVHYFCMPGQDTKSPQVPIPVRSMAERRHEYLQYWLRRVLVDILEVGRLEVCDRSYNLKVERGRQGDTFPCSGEAPLPAPMRDASPGTEQLQPQAPVLPCRQGFVSPLACLEGFIPAVHYIPSCLSENQKFEITWKLTESILYMLVCPADAQYGIQAWMTLTELVGVLTERFMKLACTNLPGDTGFNAKSIPDTAVAADGPAEQHLPTQLDLSSPNVLDASHLLCQTYKRHVGLLEGFLQSFLPGGQLQIMNVQMVQELAANVQRYGGMQL